MSESSLTEEDIRKVAQLARLEVAESELPEMHTRLSVVVSYIDRLRGLDLAGVEPLTNIGDAVNRMDEDRPGPVLDNSVLMGMAPRTMPPFVRVPKVIGDGGGA